MEQHQTTLKDLAKELKLSISTVSRALSGKHRISQETRNTVIALARKLNYHPNRLALNLLNNRTYTLGVVIPEIAFHFFSAAISGIEEAAIAAGYNIIICKSNDEYARERIVTDTLLNSKVDGLLICHSQETKDFEHFQLLKYLGIPIVFFDRLCKAIKATNVVTDDLQGSFQAVEHLIGQGCKHIAHLAGPQNISPGNQRLKGYLKALKRNGIILNKKFIIPYTPDRDSVRERISQLFSTQGRPDAVFAFNDYLAFEALEVTKAIGLKIPKQIALVGFGDEPVASYAEPKLTTVAQPAFQIGQTATEELIRLLDSKPHKTEPKNKVLKTELVVRTSSLLSQDN